MMLPAVLNALKDWSTLLHVPTQIETSGIALITALFKTGKSSENAYKMADSNRMVPRPTRPELQWHLWGKCSPDGSSRFDVTLRWQHARPMYHRVIFKMKISEGRCLRTPPYNNSSIEESVTAENNPNSNVYWNVQKTDSEFGCISS